MAYAGEKALCRYLAKAVAFAFGCVCVVDAADESVSCVSFYRVDIDSGLNANVSQTTILEEGIEFGKPTFDNISGFVGATLQAVYYDDMVLGLKAQKVIPMHMLEHIDGASTPSQELGIIDQGFLRVGETIKFASNALSKLGKDYNVDGVHLQNTSLMCFLGNHRCCHSLGAVVSCQGVAGWEKQQAMALIPIEIPGHAKKEKVNMVFSGSNYGVGLGVTVFNCCSQGLRVEGAVRALYVVGAKMLCHTVGFVNDDVVNAWKATLDASSTQQISGQVGNDDQHIAFADDDLDAEFSEEVIELSGNKESPSVVSINSGGEVALDMSSSEASSKEASDDSPPFPVVCEGSGWMNASPWIEASLSATYVTSYGWNMSVVTSIEYKSINPSGIKLELSGANEHTVNIPLKQDHLAMWQNLLCKENAFDFGFKACILRTGVSISLGYSF